MARVLVVDDDAALRRLLVRGLSGAAHDVDDSPDADHAIARLRRAQYDVVVTDLKMAGTDGTDVLRSALALQPCPAVILMSGHGTISVAVEAIKAGAFDFVEKPFTVEHMRLRVDRALETRRLKHQVAYLTHTQPDIFNFDRVVGANGALRRALELVRKVARSPSTVLIQGETGTGKELIAAALHHNSDRASAAFVRVNCAALHENLLESELFGHERGAFTSADSQRIGRFEQADGGTIFLDEIGDMSPATQAKVLRVLQQHEFERLGSSRTLKVDVRVVAATHRDLPAMVRAGTFRADLFYRLNVVAIVVPPLRDRKEDIPALTEHFLQRLVGDLKKPPMSVGPEAMARLVSHDWPGNVRELENVLERAVLLANDAVLTPEDVTIGHA